MKVRINLTIDSRLLESIKRYAASKETSVSELVENYFKALTRSRNKKNIIELVEELEKPDLDVKNLKKSFYEDQASKYGF